jgi:hypothetical protein
MKSTSNWVVDGDIMKKTSGNYFELVYLGKSGEKIAQALWLYSIETYDYCGLDLTEVDKIPDLIFLYF